MTATGDRVAPEDVRTVTCVGAGVIGGGWVAYFLARGYRVVAWDPAVDAEARLRHLVSAAWPALTELGLAEGASIDNLDVAPDLATACTHADCWPTSTRLRPKVSSSRPRPRGTG